ncbi:uncharacterized protein LOC134687767 [Mytilus trossulus]|uniref:uncharacterized protein LOC134687767 n=1 Tax=Mytilus trossulus TaxID=6551 RepID=UPI003007B90C
MADDMLRRVKRQGFGNPSKTVRCRFHEQEEYQMFCKDCTDLVCFECLGELHQKHNLCRLKDAEEDIRNEMEVLLFEGNFTEQLTALSDKLSQNRKTLAQDEERLNYEIRTSVEQMKQKIDFAEENLLSKLRNSFGSIKTTLQYQEKNINNLQTEITNLDVNKLSELILNQIINSFSEMKLCSSTCDKLINHPKPGFQPTMEFLIGNLIETPSRKRDAGAFPLHSCSNISTQTDYFEDSDTEWFDAEDLEEDDVLESSSDEIVNEYPIKFQMNQDINLVKKIVPISEKDAWIIANRKLLKIVDYALQVDVYADKVDDIVVLNDGCVLVLRYDETFIMKLLPNRRLVRFSNVDTVSYYPNCICIRDEIVVIYLWNVKEIFKDGYISNSHVIWMNTDGIVAKRSIFSEGGWKKPCSIQNLESSLCVLYRVKCESTLHSIELIEAKPGKCDMLYRFKGIYGLNPERNFECKGMCADKSRNILVSDHRHHSVYVLDKELKYKKTLFDARNGHDKPAAISLLNDQLWVADGNQMFIFQYANM